MKIWIDFDNSPHVPLFAPIISEFERLGHEVTLTARDAYQVTELTNLFDLKCKKIGRHQGKNRFMKVAGVCWRALQLVPSMVMDRPDLALSHGSRGQLLTSFLLGIPTMVMMDYEHSSQGLMWLKPSWIVVPDVMSEEGVKHNRDKVLRYRGIKEDIYVPSFSPDPSIRSQLGVGASDLLVTVRPPASEAHYHKPESDALFRTVVNYLSNQPDLKMVLLPRNERQRHAIEEMWPTLIVSGRIIVPQHVVDGLNLIWNSDFVISGGGTMNREAAALRVPVYSIFRGTIGSVDRYLAANGRLVLVESVEEVETKIKVVRRNFDSVPQNNGRFALQDILEQVTSVLTHGLSVQQQGVQ